MSQFGVRTLKPIRGISTVAILLLGFSVMANATEAPTGDGLWYYRIGGAEPVSRPANPNIVNVTLGGSADLRLGATCGAFDPMIAIRHSLNDISRGADSAMAAMTSAATGALANLPALILQRANPGLYDLFQNALLKAETTLQLATKTCEQMQSDIAAGKNPYADLITLSKDQDWKVQMGIGGNDIVRAKKRVESSNGSHGVPWIGGKAGGRGQPVLQFTGDVVRAGYNVTMNRPVTATGPVPAKDATRLTELWRTPNAARNWTVDVVGENIVTTCDTCRKDSVPGSGLLPKLNEESAGVEHTLQSLVDGSTQPTRKNLDKVTAPGVAITRQIVESIREMPATEQPLIVGRLVAEISTARTVEKALYARRLLLTGRQVPEVYATEVARQHADASIAELDKEIDTLLFESRARKEVVSNTATVLLERAAARRQASLHIPPASPVDPRPMRNGRVE